MTKLIYIYFDIPYDEQSCDAVNANALDFRSEDRRVNGPMVGGL